MSSPSTVSDAGSNALTGERTWKFMHRLRVEATVTDNLKTPDNGAQNPTDPSSSPDCESGIESIAIHRLAETDRPVAIGDLAQSVASARSASSGDPEPQAIQRVYLALVRRHLPAIAERGVVDYSTESGEVRLADGENG